MQRKSYIFTVAVIFLCISSESHVFAQATQNFRTYSHEVSGKISETQDAINAGKTIYEKYCYYCHGITGDGNGPAAPRMDQKPRDFTRNEYKIRSTSLGELPTDKDLFRIITSGIEGTPMPFWSNLSKEERWQVIYYIKTFNEDFVNAKHAEIEIGKEIHPTPQTVEHGKRLFKEAKCFLCHGNNGKGDGDITVTMKTEWDISYKARNLTKGWLFKGGNGIKDIYRTITVGINETPMGSYKEYLSDEERWYLAHYVKSISHEMNTNVVLKSKPIEGEIPVDPDNELWESAESTEIPLAGQILTRPRLWTPSINSIIVRSLYNKENIAFLLEWDDRTNEQNSVFSDSVALQFPVKLQEGSRKPFFAMGDSGNKVYILHWKAHHQLSLHSETKEQVAKDSEALDWKNPITMNIEEYNSKGANALKLQSLYNQETLGVGQWENGKWRVVIVRPQFSGDKNDTQFEKGKLIPLALAVWDGSNEENGGMKAISSWYYMALVTTTPKSIYGYIAIAIIMCVSVEFFFIARYRRFSGKATDSCADFSDK